MAQLYEAPFIESPVYSHVGSSPIRRPSSVDLWCCNLLKEITSEDAGHFQLKGTAKGILWMINHDFYLEQQGSKTEPKLSTSNINCHIVESRGTKNASPSDATAATDSYRHDEPSGRGFESGSMFNGPGGHQAAAGDHWNHFPSLSGSEPLDDQLPPAAFQLQKFTTFAVGNYFETVDRDVDSYNFDDSPPQIQEGYENNATLGGGEFDLYGNLVESRLGGDPEEDCELRLLRRLPSWAGCSPMPTPINRIAQTAMRHRSSFDAYQVRRNFARLLRRRRLRFRRRHSDDEETFVGYTEEMCHMGGLKKASARDYVCQVKIRRHGARPLGELPEVANPLIPQNNTPFRTYHKGAAYREAYLKQYSKVSICEFWPQTAMALLTGGQTLEHRLLLLWHLENLVMEAPNVVVDAAEYSRRRHTEDIMLMRCSGGGYGRSDNTKRPRPTAAHCTQSMWVMEDGIDCKNDLNSGENESSTPPIFLHDVCSDDGVGTSSNFLKKKSSMELNAVSDTEGSQCDVFRRRRHSMSGIIETMYTRLSSELWERKSPHMLAASGLLSLRGAVHPKHNSNLWLLTGCHNIGSPEKLNGGEDAHFAMNGHGGFVGVADGVGQWTEFGCDVKKFSSSLMHGCFAEVVALRGASIKVVSDNKVHNRALEDLPSSSDNDEDSLEPVFYREYLLPAVLPHAVQSSRCCEKQSKECCIGATMHRMDEPNCNKEKYECLVCDPVSIGVLHKFNCEQQTNGEDDAADCMALSPSKVAERVLRSGYSGTAKIWGASTAIVAGLDPVTGNTLGIANVGDSSILILRRDFLKSRLMTVMKRTQEQQHSFNCPFQFSRIPSEDDLEALDGGGWGVLKDVLMNAKSSQRTFDGDTVDDADLYDVKVLEGDLVIAATDGLFDNLFDHEIAHLCSLAISPYEAKFIHASEALCDAATGNIPHPNFVTPPKIDSEFGLATSPQAIAKALAEAALFRSMDRCSRTPFQRSCRKKGIMYSGGKVDDITVVVCWIVCDD